MSHSKNVLVKGCYEVLTVSRAVFYFYLMFYDTRYALLELVFFKGGGVNLYECTGVKKERLEGVV